MKQPTDQGCGKEKKMLPQDPVMLLSYINTQLRDNYPSLEELCASLGEDAAQIQESLAQIDYVYDPQTNRFV